ncbi:hypothetical protein pEaSNUABM50_00330 [Erwinia phage pEa_SNUABM_50]|uniref:Uncharacterized protein n=3 Tax=Eneladusvirus BF TaxID=2560751 RepID=A0A7L8ZPD4_9CAUD|nr:hypothetical protein FDH34_gp334 [Serratia phage BF]QOI71271.1 hypothetical protein pEaSNUABM12_00333 [Erwinia phage pEa_SNUABM_12]QOI72354.1 hypothetical protein pEaSNUABM50_00330 [Erwinia phage pEa_SNUABM_50]QXO12028.1 hypothetical protein pEaSNUABM44_00332 [Erwinia phage pEa_SNUABM_44]QXO12581.1 hypothetical protein pEaSNUABM49_00335 [Erwinia phage pEa_SNUABM_49]AQW88859.1 hypothetical protein BF_0334 [Serratia phage BF]
MKIYNMLIALHESTKTSIQQYGNVGLSKRLYVRTYEINRIGKNYDEVNRNDVSTEMVLKAYLARKVYINEKYLRGRFLIDEFYEQEVEFTEGLWRIFSMEVFGELLPELPVPTTYKELQHIFDHSDMYKEFNLYTTVKEAVIHNQIADSDKCVSIRDFDLFCSLPGIPGWTSVQHGASLVDGRTEAPQRLLQACMGMYRYDYLKCPEPYENFWKERAEAAMKKAVAILERTYIIKFRNATMYGMTPVPERFDPVTSFHWNIKRT